MTSKWKGFKVERQGNLRRFVHEGAYSSWFKPLRWSNGDLGKFEFLRRAQAWLDSFYPLGSKTQNTYNFTSVKPTTGRIKLIREPQQGGFISRSEEFKVVTARSVEIKFVP